VFDERIAAIRSASVHTEKLAATAGLALSASAHIVPTTAKIQTTRRARSTAIPHPTRSTVRRAHHSHRIDARQYRHAWHAWTDQGRGSGGNPGSPGNDGRLGFWLGGTGFWAGFGAGFGAGAGAGAWF